MDDLFAAPGVLEVIFGRGTISAYEVGNLKEGDVLAVSDRDPGSPVDVLFNGRQIATGEVMFLEGGVFGVRIVKPEWNQPPLPFSGTRDDVTELLEFYLRLAKIDITLQELAGAGENTIINLDKKTDSEAQIEAIIGGAWFAGGAICAMTGYQFGIKINSIRSTVHREYPVNSTGVIGNGEPLNLPDAHNYLPNKFSKNQVRTVSILHERIADNLRLSFPRLADYHVLLVDQVSFRDLIDKWLAGRGLVVLEAVCRHETASSPTARRFFVQSKTAVHPIADKAIRRIESSMQGVSNAIPMQMAILGYQETSAFFSVVDSTNWRAIATALRNGWKQRLSIPMLSAREIDAEYLEEMFMDMEHMLITQIGVRDTSDVVTIAYPSPFLMKIANLLE